MYFIKIWLKIIFHDLLNKSLNFPDRLNISTSCVSSGWGKVREWNPKSWENCMAKLNLLFMNDFYLHI